MYWNTLNRVFSPPNSMKQTTFKAVEMSFHLDTSSAGPEQTMLCSHILNDCMLSGEAAIPI